MFAILCAYILDLCFGDPRWFPHPVKAIGFLIKNLEKIFPKNYIGGFFMFIIIVFVPFGITFYICKYFDKGMLISIMLLYTTFSIKDLKVEAMKVYKALEKDDLILAREKLSMIVGRDTKDLNKEEIIRASVETIGESIVDGIVSPIFYAFLGGAPLAIGYKAINTLDSMIGYNNEKYKKFGFTSAKADDIVNFIPSIISGILIPIASLFMGKNFFNSFKMVFRDGIRNMINGIPESAVAGALDVKLGGLNFYNSIPVIRPFLGRNKNSLCKKHIKEGIKIAYISSFLAIIIGVVACLIL